VDLLKGLIKFWPLTCPAKEVIYISAIEEILDLLGNQAEAKFAEFGPDLLSRLILTS
jgi:hypothetical protein